MAAIVCCRQEEPKRESKSISIGELLRMKLLLHSAAGSCSGHPAPASCSSAVGTPSIFIMLPDITREIQTELKWKSWPVAKVIDTDCCSYKILLCHFAERCWLFLCVAEIRVEFESDLADSFLRRLILQFVTCERSGTGIQRVFCVIETAGSAGKEKRLH